MKYYTILFRDLDNQLVLVKLIDKQFNFDVVEAASDGSLFKADILDLNKVLVVEVDEPQEDVCNWKPLFQLSCENEQNETVDIAQLAETDFSAFEILINKLYTTALREAQKCEPVTIK